MSFPTRNYSVDSTSIAADAIQKYYTDHHADYERPERRKLSYVTIPVVATREDSNRILESAQEALTRAQTGDDFATLASEYSEDEGSAAQGGDLGYFTSGRMVHEFDSAAFATEPGKIAGPVVTRFGVHIIKVVDHKKGAEGDSVRASHILLKWKVSSDTDERAGQKAKDFQEAAKTDGMAEAAKKFESGSQGNGLVYQEPKRKCPRFWRADAGAGFCLRIQARCGQQYHPYQSTQ